MWFWLSLIALLCWSGSDLFSKIGCRDADDKLAHLKMVIAVGVVMGLHAAYEIFIGGVSISWHVIWTYLPVSLLYIVSMALGYIGLRYIELSISSPICNASGAVVAVLYLCFGGLDEDLTGGMRIMALAAVALVCLGVIGLGVVESRGMTSCAARGRPPRTTATPRAGSRSRCRWPTACSTPPARLPTASCSEASTRTRPTARMS